MTKCNSKWLCVQIQFIRVATFWGLAHGLPSAKAIENRKKRSGKKKEKKKKNEREKRKSFVSVSNFVFTCMYMWCWYVEFSTRQLWQFRRCVSLTLTDIAVSHSKHSTFAYQSVLKLCDTFVLWFMQFFFLLYFILGIWYQQIIFFCDKTNQTA